MTSPYARPDRAAVEELSRLVGALESELATWRDRAQRTEPDTGPLKGKGAQSHELQQARLRITSLENENHAMEQRIAAAREQVERLRSRLRFVEDHEAEGVA